jgi:hypothetical protein
LLEPQPVVFGDSMSTTSRPASHHSRSCRRSAATRALTNQPSVTGGSFLPIQSETTTSRPSGKRTMSPGRHPPIGLVGGFAGSGLIMAAAR